MADMIAIQVLDSSLPCSCLLGVRSHSASQTSRESVPCTGLRLCKHPPLNHVLSAVSPLAKGKQRGTSGLPSDASLDRTDPPCQPPVTPSNLHENELQEAKTLVCGSCSIQGPCEVYSSTCMTFQNELHRNTTYLDGGKRKCSALKRSM